MIHGNIHYRLDIFKVYVSFARYVMNVYTFRNMFWQYINKNLKLKSFK